MGTKVRVFIDEQKLQNITEQARCDGVQKFVVGAIIAKAGRILLLERHSQETFLPDLMELPSGTVEPSESLVDALVREIAEETGLVCTSVEAYLGSFDYFSGSGKWTRQFNFRIDVEGELVLSTEHRSYRFVIPSIEELHDLNISVETQNVILSTNSDPMPSER